MNLMKIYRKQNWRKKEPWNWLCIEMFASYNWDKYLVTSKPEINDMATSYWFGCMKIAFWNIDQSYIYGKPF